jgi:hypothetical protein
MAGSGYAARCPATLICRHSVDCLLVAYARPRESSFVSSNARP